MSVPPMPGSKIETLTTLLRYFQWSPVSGEAGRYEVWTTRESNESEIIVPLDLQRGDYESLVDRGIKAILVKYGRVADEVSATLAMRSKAVLDATRWKKETALDAGIIGWDQGESLFLAARSQLAASAKSTREPRRYHGNSSAYLAKRFLEGSFMGQTDIGSFVVTAYTPAGGRFFLSKSAEQHSTEGRSHLWESETVGGRDVLNTFASALEAVRDGLDEYRKSPRIEIFVEAVEQGVSYELVKALGEFTSDGNSEIQIERQPIGDGASSIAEVAFASLDAPILDSAAIALAVDPEPKSVTLIGEVTLLSRSSDTAERLIRLNIAEGADIRKARVRLTSEQYELAMEAHKQESSLKVSGSLEKEGKLFWLYGAENVSIVSDDVPVDGSAQTTNQDKKTLFEQGN